MDGLLAGGAWAGSANARNHSRPKPAHRHRSGQPGTARQPVVAAGPYPVRCQATLRFNPWDAAVAGLGREAAGRDGLRERAWVLILACAAMTSGWACGGRPSLAAPGRAANAKNHSAPSRRIGTAAGNLHLRASRRRGAGHYPVRCQATPDLTLGCGGCGLDAKRRAGMRCECGRF